MNQPQPGENTKTKSLLEQLQETLTQEVWSRNDIGALSTTKLKETDELIDRVVEAGEQAAARKAAAAHLEDHNESTLSKYILGILGLLEKRPEDTTYLRTIMEQFRELSKWQLLVHTADRMLQFGDNRYALRAIVEGMDQGSYPKAKVQPYYEKLAKIDRKNPEVAEKYGRNLIDEGEKEKGLGFIKQAAEAYARTDNLEKLNQCWRFLVDLDPDDLSFFEKIERIILNNRHNIKASELLMQLVDYQSSLLDMAGDDDKKRIWQSKVTLLKRVLAANPQYQKARSDIVATFKKIYSEHSLLNEFIRHSELDGKRNNVLLAIEEFEKNIVFDKGNYVAHKNWGVGKIIDLNQDEIQIDFKNKPNHVMSIKMALKSLKALPKDHIWVQYYENSEGMQKLFDEEPVEFIKTLLKSFGSVMLMAEIKAEVIECYLDAKEWSKWWTKTKTQLKKDPHIGFSARKKDEIFYREEEIPLAEELVEKFSVAKDHNKRIDLAMEAAADPVTCQDAIITFITHFNNEENSKVALNRLVAYFVLEQLGDAISDEEVHSVLNREVILETIKGMQADEITAISAEIKNLDIKKSFLAAIKAAREDYPKIYAEILFEVPIKVHKYVFNELQKEKKFDTLNEFIGQALLRLKEQPEVFLWVAKNILNEQWNFDWLRVQFEDVTLRVFRLLRPLGKIETTGSKLKKMAQDILFGNKATTLRKTIDGSDDSTVRKMAALFREVPYIEDAQKNRLLDLINEIRPNFKWYESEEEQESERSSTLTHIPGDDVIMVTRDALTKKEEEYNHLVKVDMVENSKDIGEAQKLGDLRENAEYKAAMERQQLLQATMTKMDADFKKVKVIDPADILDGVACIGSKIKLRNKSNNDEQVFTILGPWDANSENQVISYKSPLAQALIGKQTGDVVSYTGSPDQFEILGIDKAL